MNESPEREKVSLDKSYIQDMYNILKFGMKEGMSAKDCVVDSLDYLERSGFVDEG